MASQGTISCDLGMLNAGRLVEIVIINSCLGCHASAASVVVGFEWEEGCAVFCLQEALKFDTNPSQCLF